MTLTLAITTYNRYDLLLESFAEVIDDQRIGEVLILDDCSSASYWNKIAELPATNPKIRVIRQPINRGMSVNKSHAIAFAANEWVIIGDSDNIFKKDYLDSIPLTLQRDTIYCPDFAWPSFDYRELSGKWIDKFNIHKIIQTDAGNMSMNTSNYLVNRDEYSAVFEENKNMKGTDTIWFAYLWLKAYKRFYIVPGMTYFHRVHSQSGFLQDVAYNMMQAEKIKQLILEL